MEMESGTARPPQDLAGRQLSCREKLMLPGRKEKPWKETFEEAGRMEYFSCATLAVLILAAGLTGCGGGGGSGSSPPPPVPPNLAGVWAGSWTGTDPSFGVVTGTWVADIAESNTSVSGSASLRGDIDCMDGVLAGSANSNNAVIGTFDRSPCQLNQWTLTAVNPAA